MWSGFTTLWACYILLSYNYGTILYRPPEEAVLYFCLWVSASLLLFLPRSLPFLVSSACTYIIIECITLPRIMNSSIISTGVHILIIYTVLSSIIKKQSSHRTRKLILEKMQFFYPLAISIVYFWAGFHKLNFGFFNPISSCINTFIDHGKVLFPLVKSYNTKWTPLIAGLTVLLELGLPIFIIRKKTRHTAMTAGVLFHFWLGLIVPTFSLIIFIGYFFLLNNRTVQRAFRKIFQYRKYWLLPIFILTNIKSTLFAFIAVQFLSIPSPHYILKGLNLAFASIVFTVLFLFIIFYRKESQIKNLNSLFSKKSKLATLLLIFIFINGASPYLGLKTITSFSMYSNLHVSQWSNHFLIPHGTFTIFPYIDDTAKIITIDTKSKYFHQGDRISKIQLYQILKQPQYHIPFSFQYNESITKISNRQEALNFAIKVPYWQTKTLGFTHTSDLPPQKCDW